MAYSKSDNQAMAKVLKEKYGFMDSSSRPNTLINKSTGSTASNYGGSWTTNNGNKSTDLHHGKTSGKMWK